MLSEHNCSVLDATISMAALEGPQERENYMQEQHMVQI